MSLAALGDGHHGGFRPDVDGGGPIYALDTAGFNRHDVFGLLFFGVCVREGVSFPTNLTA